MRILNIIITVGKICINWSLMILDKIVAHI